ncbi:MAG: RNA 2',3'-cyclic phosphodiesterase [Promethearchaeota archaeon]
MTIIRSFIAVELKNKESIKLIENFTLRLKTNQKKINVVKPENLHMTIKFLGDITEVQAPKIYKIVKEVNDKYLNDKTIQYRLMGVGQFNKYSVIWVRLKGDVQFMQNIKDTIENRLYKELNIERDTKKKFKAHLTIARLNKKRIDYKTMGTFKKILEEKKSDDFGIFNVSAIKLKKSELTPQGPIYTDLMY